jgi:hypothetical protein
MMRADEIIDQIDGALYDWSVSDDAMRSRPADETRAATVSVMGEDGQWQEIGTAVSFELDVDTGDFQQQWQAARERMIRLHVERAERMQAAMDEFIRAFTEAMKPAAEAASRGMAEIAAALQRPAGEAATSRQRNFRHLPEAEGCNQCGPPRRPRDRPAWQSPYGPPRRRR